MDVVAAVSTQPTYRPSSRIRQFNDIAEFLGDDRAANARALWDKPLKAVVIKSCGLYNTARTQLAPGLPWIRQRCWEGYVCIQNRFSTEEAQEENKFEGECSVAS